MSLLTLAVTRAICFREAMVPDIEVVDYCTSRLPSIYAAAIYAFCIAFCPTILIFVLVTRPSRTSGANAGYYYISDSALFSSKALKLF